MKIMDLTQKNWIIQFLSLLINTKKTRFKILLKIYICNQFKIKTQIKIAIKNRVVLNRKIHQENYFDKIN